MHSKNMNGEAYYTRKKVRSKMYCRDHLRVISVISVGRSFDKYHHVRDFNQMIILNITVLGLYYCD